MLRSTALFSLRFSSACVVLAATLGAQASQLGEKDSQLGFEERFALATDRDAAIAELVPGTEEAYFYRCLHLQNQGRLEEVPALLAEWIERHGRSPRSTEIENRQMLLDYERDPAGTFERLRRRLGLQFDHQRTEAGARPDLPTRLDPGLLDPTALYRRALEKHPGSLDGLRERALPALAATDFSPNLLHALLQRLERPDVPGIAQLVVRDLERPRAEPFGSIPLHKKLLLEQLEECARLRPALLESDAFVSAWVARLAPSNDVDLERNARERLAYLDRLESFVRTLAPAHDSLKAHVLYHRLAHDLQQGAPDKQRLLDYLRLPRNVPYANADYVKRARASGALVALDRAFPTALEPIRDDEELVRAWLMHFLREEDSWEPYAELIDERYVRLLFAETKLLAGTGDLERWTALADDPAWLEALKERVEIEFAPTQPSHYRADDPVAIDVDVKNAGTLLVKVFAIDAFNYYRAEEREVDESIPIDGLVATVELSESYQESPLRRVRRRFELPQLSGPGVYVVELIGNGRSSRAVIQKGALQLLERRSAAGQVLTVLDEDGRARPAAQVWIGGRRIEPDKRGDIVVPYSTDGGAKTIVIRDGELASLATLVHREESYDLSAGAFVERESLLSGRRAKLIVRPSLTVDGRPIPIELLEDPKLAITATDVHGTESSQVARDIALSSAGELEHEIQVPYVLTRLTVTLSGRVRSLSRGEDVELASAESQFILNTIASTEQTWSTLLGRSASGWHLDLLGRNGEPKADRAIQLELELRDFTDNLQVTLRSDERGRIELGELAGVVRLSTEGSSRQLSAEARDWPQSVHGTAGSVLRIPYQGRASEASRAVLSLIELRNGEFARDAFEHAAIRGGFVELTGLVPGDYDLLLPEAGVQVDVRVTAGEVRGGWAHGVDRRLEIDPEPLHIAALGERGGNLTVQLANASARARVHVAATRYVPEFDPFQRLAAPGSTELQVAQVERGAARYHSGRAIGEEYRYILERRYARRFPGNMLPRPGLLLNPWSLEETLTRSEGGASAFSSRRAGGGGKGGGGLGQGGRGGRGGGPTTRSIAPYPDLDFLPEPARLLANLRPDANGLVSVPLADLGPGQHVHVIAIDGESTVYSSLALPEKPLAPSDRRLMRPLDPAQPFAEQEHVVRVEAGASSTIDDLSSARSEQYGSLSDVFRLYRTLSSQAELERFDFLLRWPQLAEAEKRELYSKHACHEVHVFLAHRDPRFFAEVVRPYLANKVDKTFLDRWLLEEDLEGYLAPAAFARLNTVERIFLTGRLANRSADGARRLREAVVLLPRKPERARRLFEAALSGGALEIRAGEVATGSSEFFTGPATPATDGPGTPGEFKGAGDTVPPSAAAVAAEDDAELERARRAEVRELYRSPDRTQAWAESNYWKIPIHHQDAELVGPSAFWLDYALREPSRPFLSEHFAEPGTGSLTEMLLALSVLDLPFEAGEHAVERTDNRLTLTAATPLLLVRKDVLAAQPAPADEPPLLLSQNLLCMNDRWREGEDGQKREAYLSGELVVDVPYACQVVATNPTSAQRRLDLLLQIPEGSLPIAGGWRTRSLEIELGPYATHNLEYAFYFPSPGTFRHYPVHASREGAQVAAAPAATWTVVPVPTMVDTTSWEHVSQLGTEEEVLAYLERSNLQRTDLSRLAWRMRERPFFERTLDLLRRRLTFERELWSYGLLHQDERTARDYLAQEHAFLAQCGLWLDTRLVSIDPVERRTWEILEFEPLFNARAHALGGRRELLNESLARQYRTLLEILAYRPALDADDRLALTYYLLLQDRVGEALEQFAAVDPEQLASRLQYDYFRAYLDFFSDEHALARGVADAYREHPVQRWRERFGEVLRQLDEAGGAQVASAGSDDRTRRQTELAVSGPSLELALEGRRARIAYDNLERCEVRYYPLDVEFQFSSSPFARRDGEAAVFVRPRRSDQLALEAGEKELVFDLPAELAGANLLVEVRGGGLVRRQAAYASTLDVQTFESYGQLAVTSAETGVPLPKVYVKVYARSDKDVRFYKDGYTDLRGRFDYASLSGDGAERPDRFAILVLSDTEGAALREVDPPLK